MSVVAQSKIDAFTEHHPKVTDWLIAKQLVSNFAASLLLQVRSRGMLTERQLAAVERILAQDEARAKIIEAAPALDLAKLEATFQIAKDHGVNQPKLRLGNYLFKVASAMGNNAGAIWVTVAAKDEFGERPYLGKIKDGVFQAARTCSAEQAAEIAQVASNPAEAAKAYGRRTGMCCVCGRELTRNESIDAMIGPICAGKYGF